MGKNGLSQQEYERYALFFSRCSRKQQDALFYLQGLTEFVRAKSFKKRAGKNAEGFVLMAKEACVIKTEKGFIGLTCDFGIYLERKEARVASMARGEIRNERGVPVANIREMR